MWPFEERKECAQSAVLGNCLVVLQQVKVDRFGRFIGRRLSGARIDGLEYIYRRYEKQTFDCPAGASDAELTRLAVPRDTPADYLRVRTTRGSCMSAVPAPVVALAPLLTTASLPPLIPPWIRARRTCKARSSASACSVSRGPSPSME